MDINNYPKLADVRVGDTVRRPVLVGAVKEAVDKNGNTFVKITVKDGMTDVTAMMFKADKKLLESMGVTEGSVADIQLNISDYNGAKSYKIEKISPTKDTSLSAGDFIKMPPLDIDLMYSEICELVKSSANDYGGKYTPLSQLALKILDDKKQQYMTSSAAVTMHHNIRSGLLYHSYRMVKAADAICGIYSKLDRELLLCGTALHDIGKIWEYSTSPLGDAEFTSSGVLFGHLYLGASLIKKYSAADNYNMEKVQLLTHLILAHHGTREFGAVVCPAIPEAFALYYIDNLDAKMYVCEEQYEQLPPGAITEKKPFGLDNRIYRPAISEFFDD